MLPTSAGAEPATSWSPVGWRIQLSHRGWLSIVYIRLENHYRLLDSPNRSDRIHENPVNAFEEKKKKVHQLAFISLTNCAPLLADLFLYSYEAEFVQGLLQAGKKHLAQQFKFTYRYIDDASLKSTKFAEYLEFIYPCELEIKDTMETAASSSYLDCYLYIDNGKLTTRLTTNEMTSIFPLLTFHSWIVISLLHQHTAFMFHN